MKKILITAHAGCMNTPMDSLESVRAGMAAGADVVEVDVRFRDGLALLSHEALQAGDYCHLRDALAILAERAAVQLNIDLKEFDPVGLRALSRQLAAAGLIGRVFFTGVTAEYAARVAAHTDGIPLFLNCAPQPARLDDADYAETLCALVRAQGCAGLNLNYRYAAKTLVDRFHANDTPVYVWTVNTPRDAAAMAALGVDAITTRDVPMVRRAICNDTALFQF
jgi:glycerophosphoryl diester phosphodiesterase